MESKKSDTVIKVISSLAITFAPPLIGLACGAHWPALLGLLVLGGVITPLVWILLDKVRS